MLQNIQYTALILGLISLVLIDSAPYKRWPISFQSSTNAIFNISAILIVITTLIIIWI